MARDDERAHACRPTYRLFEAAATATAALSLAALASRLLANPHGRVGWLLLAAASLTAYVLADLVSGLVHWLADRFGSGETFLIGPSLIQPFRDHHAHPLEITSYDFLDTNGNSCIVGAPVLVVTLLLAPSAPEGLLSRFTIAVMLCLGIAI